MDHERLRRMHGLTGGSMKTASFEARLKGKVQLAEGTTAFVFEKPVGFQFRAGQHVRMTLIAPPETDGEGDSRFLSLASTPQDPDLVVAMRMRDTAFKRVLQDLKVGEKVLVQMRLDVPNGAFALHDDPSRPAVFLAGGIGIVSALSMVRDALERKLPHRMFLFYSNRRPEDAAYLEDLQRLAEENSSFSLVATMTAAGTSSPTWAGETGRIDRLMLAKHLGDLKAPIYYVSGLPDMVSAVTAILSDSGVDADGIKAEEFAGFDLNQMHRPAGQKRNRWVLIGALALATAAIVLHLSAAFSIFSNSFGGILKANPVFYVVVGVLLGGSSSRSGTLPACTTAAGASLVTSAGILAAMRPRPWASNADRQRSGDPHMAASSQRRPMGLAAVV